MEKAYENKMKYVNLLRTRPIAIETAKVSHPPPCQGVLLERQSMLMTPGVVIGE